MLTIVIACRRSPARLAGATCPIATLTVAPPSELSWWDETRRTLRLLRGLEGLVTIECQARWGDFAVEYAALVAQAFDGVVGVGGELFGEISELEGLAPLTERQLTIAWRALDDRAHTTLDDYDRAMRVKQLAWEAATVVGTAPAPGPASRPLD